MATTNQAAGKAATKKKITQTEIINHFAAKFDLKREQAKEIFTELSELATREVNKNGEFQLPGLGKLVRAERKAHEGRNPATRETIKIAAKTTLKFRLGKAIKDTVIPAKK